MTRKTTSNSEREDIKCNSFNENIMTTRRRSKYVYNTNLIDTRVKSRGNLQKGAHFLYNTGLGFLSPGPKYVKNTILILPIISYESK